MPTLATEAHEAHEANKANEANEANEAYNHQLIFSQKCFWLRKKNDKNDFEKVYISRGGVKANLEKAYI